MTMKSSPRITIGVAVILAIVVAVALLSAGPYLGFGVSTVTSISTENQTVVEAESPTTSTITVHVYSVYSTTITSYSTTSTVVPVLSENPPVTINSTKLVVVTPDGFIIYDTTALNNGTLPVDNVTMVFQNQTFHSQVSGQDPLMPGQSTVLRFSYYPYTPVNTSAPAPLHVALLYGTFGNGQAFAFVETVKLVWTNGVPIAPLPVVNDSRRVGT
ncbi:MAG: hypothetical protein JRN03_08375 [Nitrososphaerota archaeon]|nr:hypothetical protein [Nitrososphaerota archaeon]